MTASALIKGQTSLKNGIAQMCTVFFIEFAAAIWVYSVSDLLRQELITQSAPELILVRNLQDSASEGELSKEVDLCEITELRKEIIM